MLLTGIARLGRDAELRYLTDGTPVAALALATNYGKKDAQGSRPTQWIDASLFGEQAKKLAPYLLKGQLVSVTCSEPHIDQYQRRDGTVGHALRARVINIEFAGKAPEKPAGAQGAASTNQQAPAAAGNAPAANQSTATSPGNFGDFDDDIPF